MSNNKTSIMSSSTLHPHLASLPSQSELLEDASDPLNILALFSEATDRIGPKLFAGGASCMAISLALNPMDVIKVRLQTQPPAPVQAVLLSSSTSPSAAPTVDSRKYRTFFQTGATIYQEEGYRRGLMRGITASLLREASYSSLRMGLFDLFTVLMNGPMRTRPSNPTTPSKKRDISFAQKMIAGGLSGAIGAAVATPIDLVKIRFQGYTPVSPNPYRNSFHALSTIYGENGLRGLYRGASPTILRAAILTATQLTSYTTSKRLMLNSGHFQDDSVTHIAAAVISGLTTTTACNPVDVIKTRVMCDATKQYSSPIDCVVKTLRNEGPRAFMRGWLPNYLRLGPHFLLSLPLAEYIRVSLGADSF